jgi:hypothetical protein
MKKYTAVVLAVLVSAAAIYAEQATVALDGKSITINYSAPAAKNRATAAFHTDADLAFKGFSVPKGDYTIYILVDAAQWQFAVNKASGAKAATYDAKLDLGRVPMTMGKPAGPADACKITVTRTAALAAKVEVVWNNAAASAPFHLDRGASNTEW